MDLYIVLGVQREATEVEIKRAYRRLARRLHPDINPGDHDAADRFRQILHAYETLSDPDRRRRYDSGASGSTADEDRAFGFAGFDFSTSADARRAPTFGDLFEEVFTRRTDRQAASNRGADLHMKANLTFDAAWRGVEWPITLTRQDVCRVCAGSGYHRTVESRCLTCEGSGAVRSMRGHMVFTKTCPTCGGTGRLLQRVCDACQGQGVERRTETIPVMIPAGIADGARVRVPSKGHAGLRGGPPGDLYIEVSVAPHPDFQRVGDDLQTSVSIEIHEAALGARIEIPTPDGSARLRIPPGTQSGQRFRLRERGLPSPRGGPRGDIVVEVRLMLPKLLDERSKALLREFGRLNGQTVRQEERRIKDERRTGR